MSIESLAPCTEVPAPSIAPVTAAEPAPASTRVQGADVAAAAAAPLSLQERRLRVARELDARINRLEQDIRQAGDALAKSRLATTESLRELQQRSTSLTTELLRVGARLAQQGSAHEKRTRHIEHRIGTRLQEIECALASHTTELRIQQEGQYELQQRHDSLTRLHEHLDRIVNRQGRNLDILAAEFQQRVELLRISINGMQEIFQAQQESLIGLTLEHEQLALLTRQLQAQMGGLAARLELHVDDTRQRLRSQTLGLAALTLLGLGLITYCQFNPVAIPGDVSAQLAMMASRLEQQEAQATTLGEQNRLQDGRLAALTAALETERHETRRLRQQVRRTGNRLANLDRQFAALGTAPNTATATPQNPQPSVPAEARQSAPVGGGLVLPLALPGSRPDF